MTLRNKRFISKSRQFKAGYDDELCDEHDN